MPGDFIKQRVRDELNSLIGNHIPNPVHMENLVSYLTKVFVLAYKDDNMEEEAAKISGLTPVDRQRALHTFEIYAALQTQDSVTKILQDTFTKYRYSLNPILREASHSEHKSLSIPFQSFHQGTDFVVERDFPIEVSEHTISADVRSELNALQSLSSEASESSEARKQNREPLQSFKDFEIADNDLRKFNFQEPPIFTTHSQVQQFSTGGQSSQPHETYTSVPKIDTDLDY